MRQLSGFEGQTSITQVTDPSKSVMGESAKLGRNLPTKLHVIAKIVHIFFFLNFEVYTWLLYLKATIEKSINCCMIELTIDMSRFLKYISN